MRIRNPTEARNNMLENNLGYDCKAKPLVEILIADVNSKEIDNDPYFCFISDPDPKIDLSKFLTRLLLDAA